MIYRVELEPRWTIQRDRSNAFATAFIEAPLLREDLFRSEIVAKVKLNPLGHAEDEMGDRSLAVGCIGVGDRREHRRRCRMDRGLTWRLNDRDRVI